MEKRKPSFEKWTYDKYGPISGSKDPIVMQKSNVISVSGGNFLFRKEGKNPDKYIVICNDKVPSYLKEKMEANNINIEPHTPITMDKAELESFCYMVCKFLYGYYGNANLVNRYGDMAKVIDNMLYFIVTTTFSLGDVHLNAAQAEQLVEGLEAVTNG